MNFKIILLVIFSIFVYQNFITKEEDFEHLVNTQLVPLEDFEIDFYTTSWCGYCKAARKHMNANNIPYTEYDIEKDALGKIKYERIMKEIGKEGKKSIPMFQMGDKVFHGFSKKKFNRELNLARGV